MLPMNDNNSPIPMRRMSDRKSKPSMEALVDHHRPVYWIPPQNQHQQNHSLQVDDETPVLIPAPEEEEEGIELLINNSHENTSLTLDLANNNHDVIKEVSDLEVSPGVLQTEEASIITDKDKPITSPQTVAMCNSNMVIDLDEEPMRIRIRLARLDPTTLTSSSTVISTPIADSQHLPVPSHINGTYPGITPMEDDNNDYDSDEDNLPLSDLCKRVAHPNCQNFEKERATIDPPKRRTNRRKRILKPPTSPTLTPSPIRCRTCAQPATSGDLRWDGQFCSPDCIVKACRDAFMAHRRLQTFRNTAHSNNLAHQTVS